MFFLSDKNYINCIEDNNRMKESEEKFDSRAEQKQKIRERYKGVDPDSLDVIPAKPRIDIYETDIEQRVPSKKCFKANHSKDSYT